MRDSVFIICLKTDIKVMVDGTQTPDEEARTLLMAASFLRKAVWITTLYSGLMGHFPMLAKNNLFQIVHIISTINSLQDPKHR